MEAFKGLKWAVPISLILWFLLYQVTVAEGLHLDAGIAYHDEEKDSFIQRDGTDISNLIGEVELSYEWENGTRLSLRHNSSMQQLDTGLNMIILKARLF